MTEAEAMDLVAAFNANASTNFTIFISFTFGFLATAFFVGAKLSRIQALVASVMYTVSAGSAALSCIGWLQAFDSMMKSQTTLLGAIPLFNSQFWVGGMAVLFVTGMSVSVYFMWSIRHPKSG